MEEFLYVYQAAFVSAALFCYVIIHSSGFQSWALKDTFTLMSF